MHLRNTLAKGMDAESYSLHTFEALLTQSMENLGTYQLHCSSVRIKFKPSFSVNFMCKLLLPFNFFLKGTKVKKSENNFGQSKKAKKY